MKKINGTATSISFNRKAGANTDTVFVNVTSDHINDLVLGDPSGAANFNYPHMALDPSDCPVIRPVTQLIELVWGTTQKFNGTAIVDYAIQPYQSNEDLAVVHTVLDKKGTIISAETTSDKVVGLSLGDDGIEVELANQL